MRFRCWAAALLWAGEMFLPGAAPVFSQDVSTPCEDRDCGYFMCRYEKGNIDTIIVEHARSCQTVMFGEIHNSVVVGTPAPVSDSRYVTTLLARLKAVGYRYLALEVVPDAPAGSHSGDIAAFYKAYRQKEGPSPASYPNAQPGWIDLLRAAMDIGYRIRFIDAAPGDRPCSTPRDKAMFEAIKRDIFDHDPAAKVIVYVGANHIGECETHAGVYFCKGKRRPLGYFLDRYTRGKNFSVYMGHTYDTPEGCDLFISHFIWDQ